MVETDDLADFESSNPKPFVPQAFTAIAVSQKNLSEVIFYVVITLGLDVIYSRKPYPLPRKK